MQGRIKEGQVYLVVASFASSAGVSFSLLTLVCSEVLTDTEVFLRWTELGLSHDNYQTKHLRLHGGLDAEHCLLS